MTEHEIETLKATCDAQAETIRQISPELIKKSKQLSRLRDIILDFEEMMNAEEITLVIEEMLDMITSLKADLPDLFPEAKNEVPG